MVGAENPLYQVYLQFWAMLEANALFTTAVPNSKRNRIKYTSLTDRNPDRDRGVQDYPSVRVVARGMKVIPHFSSNSTKIVVHWGIDVATGDQRLSELFDITMAICCALVDWQDSFADMAAYADTDGEIPFAVKRCRPAKVTETVGTTRDTQGVKGWTSVWDGEMDLWFSTALLKNL